MKFYKTVFEICKGTNIFLEIQNYSLRKTLGYLSLLLIACSFFISIPQSIRTNETVFDATSKFKIAYGKISFEKDGVYPSLTPNISNTILIADEYRLDYIHDAKLDVEKLKSSICEKGIVWTPKALLSWSKSDAGLIFLNNPFISLRQQKSILDENEISDFLIESNKKEWNPIFGIQQFDFEINSYILFIYIFLGYNLVPMMFVSITYMLIFSLMHSLMNFRFSLKEIKKQFILNTFTSFPGIIIASLLPALKIDFSYTTMFIICFVVYSFPVNMKIIKSKMQK